MNITDVKASENCSTADSVVWFLVSLLKSQVRQHSAAVVEDVVTLNVLLAVIKPPLFPGNHRELVGPHS